MAEAESAEGRGAGGTVAVIIGAVASAIGAAADDRQVVFFVIGVLIFPFAPLGHWLVIASAHDRGPTGVATSLARVIARAAGTIVDKTKGMTHLMADGFGCGFFMPIPQLFFEDEGGAGGTIAEHIHIGNSTGSDAEPVIAAASDHHPSAPGGVPRHISLGEGGGTGIFCGYINVEGGKVFGNSLPDELNTFQLVITKNINIAVEIIFWGGDG